jgi:integrase/transcriptional regulator NrdR family protein
MSSCPQCGSAEIVKDGWRKEAGKIFQRYLCKGCDYRFSLGHNNSKIVQNIVGSGHLGTVLQEVNKMAATIEKVAGERKLDKAAVKGLLLQYAVYLQKQGYPENSRYIDCIRMLLHSEGANIYDPENIKEVIAAKKWKNGTKMQVSYAYDSLVKMLNLTWEMPTYRQEDCLPFIPEQKELDALISGARSQRLTAFLQTLKETFADPTEALRLRWIDINGNSITINGPVRGHNPRQLPVSNKLLAMLNALPHNSELIFPTNYRNMEIVFKKMRKRIARNLDNPRILKITLTTFRHFGATWTYFHTRNILLVMKMLGHKQIKNTLKYTQLIQFKDDEYEVATATSVEETKKVLEAGFDYVCEKDGILLFRKPKRYME